MERLSELENEVRRYHQLKIVPMSFFIVSTSIYILSLIVQLLPLPDYVIESLTSEHYFSMSIMSLVLWMSYIMLHRARMRRFKLDELLKHLDELEDGSLTLNEELIEEIKKHLN